MGFSQLAGRARERRTVADVLTGKASTRVLLVTGDPGVGKSFLVTAVSAELADEVLVLSGSCLSLSEDLPLLPFVDVLTELYGVDQGALMRTVLAACPPFVTEHLGLLLPELATAGPPRPMTGGLDPWQRQRLFASVSRVLAAVAEQGPTAVVIEDAQWADSASRDLMSYLVTRPGRDAVPMVLTSRSDETALAATRSLVRQGDAVTLSLTPLSRGETAELIGLLGVEPAEDVLDELFGRSQGNPFFVRQLLSDGRSVGARLPEDLRALLVERVSRCSSGARSVVTALSVAAGPMTEKALAAATDLSEEAVADVLHELAASHLLRAVPGKGGELVHVLVGEAVVADLTTSEVRRWHARVGSALAAGAGDADVAAVAEHFGHAELLADELRWRARAGQRATAVGAHAQAADQWRRVLSLWDRVEEPERAVGSTLTEVGLLATWALAFAGHGIEAGHLVSEVKERLLVGADDLAQLRVLYVAGRFGGITDKAQGRVDLDTAVAIGERLGVSADYVSVLHVLSQRRSSEPRENVESLIHRMERALVDACSAGLVSEAKLLTGDLAWWAMVANDEPRARALVDEAASMVCEDPLVDLTVGVYISDVLLKYGDLQRVLLVGHGPLARAEEGGYLDVFEATVLASNVLEALRESGDLAEADRFGAGLRETPVTTDSVFIHLELAAVDAALGRLDEAARFWVAAGPLVAGLTDVQHLHELALVRVELLLWLGRPAEALDRVLDVFRGMRDDRQAVAPGGLFVLGMRACADLAQQDRARELPAAVTRALTGAEELSDRLAACRAGAFAGGVGAVTASAEQLTWYAERTRLTGKADPSRWSRAARTWTELGRPHRAAYACWRAAEAALAEPAGRAVAKPLLISGLELAGTHVLLQAVMEDLAKTANITLPSPQGQPVDREDRTPFGLTDRELAVLLLVGDGRTNAEIGRELFISPKTASVHVTNILRKLDVRSRVQAAAVAAQSGLLADAGRGRAST